MQHYEEKNARGLVVRLLNALKSFYTFKDLESMLEIPQQALWRYVNFLTVPEESTAKRILRKIEELKLIDKILDRMIRPNERGRIEVWRLVSNIGFLDILGFHASLIPEVNDVDIVLAFPEDSSVLAASIAHWTRINMCIATRRADKLLANKYVVETYHSDISGQVEYLAVPKGCIEKDDYVLLVTNILSDVKMLDAAYSVVRKSQGIPWALLAIAILDKDVLDAVRSYGLRSINVLKILR